MIEAPAGAILSADQRHRYVLWRRWETDLPSMTWIMLNPSTADAAKDDATIRICRGRAERTGYGGIYVVNLFALRATNPARLYELPVHQAVDAPETLGWNDQYIETYARRSDLVICAWGNHGALHGRGALVAQMLQRWNIPGYALRLTKSGCPVHPLRIPYSQAPQRWV